MKPVDIRYLVPLILSILIFPSFVGSNSEFGDIIKGSPEYKKITKEKKKTKKDDSHYHRHYHDPFYGPLHRSCPPRYDQSVGSGRGSLPGLLYLGITIGESEFDYDDIDDGDTSIFYVGFRPEDSRLGYELSFYNSGDSEVTSLTDIELQVETINLMLTLNSSMNNKSPLNLSGKAGIYFADATLSGPFDSVKEKSNGFLLGVGVEFALNQHFSLRADAYILEDVEDFANDESISIFSLGGQFYF